MKRIAIIGFLAAAAVVSLAANGKQEEPEAPYGYGRGPRGGAAQGWDKDDRGNRGGPMYWTDEEGNPITPELVEAEGSLVLEEGTHPYLEQDGEKVFLMVPAFAIYDLELEGGESIKVSGYEMPEGMGMSWGGTSTYLKVVEAEINGETLTLEGGFGPKGRQGRRGGPSGGGPRGW